MLLECHHCEAIVDAKEIANFVDVDEAWNTKYTFGNCPACNSALLARQFDTGDGWDKPVRVFPPRDRNLHSSVPKPIRAAFTEGRACFRAKLFTAAAIMCRKTLEGICSAHGVGSSTADFSNGQKSFARSATKQRTMSPLQLRGKTLAIRSNLRKRSLSTSSLTDISSKSSKSVERRQSRHQRKRQQRSRKAAASDKS